MMNTMLGLGALAWVAVVEVVLVAARVGSARQSRRRKAAAGRKCGEGREWRG
jgi:hypothetical protein